jgi:hypothetical protein
MLVDIDWPEGDVEGRSGSVVIIFGWFGARKGQLTRYSRMLCKQGYVVGRCVMPPGAVLGLDSRRREFVEGVLEEMDQALPPGRTDLIVYCFSNGGTLAYEQILLSANLRQFVVKGVVIDSAPGQMCFSKAYLTLWAMKNHTLTVCTHLVALLSQAGVFQAFKQATGLLLPNWSAMQLNVAASLSLIMSWVLVSVILARRNTQYWTRLAQSPSDYPELYLYSDTDRLCEAHVIEKLVRSRRDRQPHLIQSKRFEGSAHVQHFLRFPAEYETTLSLFLSLCHSRLSLRGAATLANRSP